METWNEREKNLNKSVIHQEKEILTTKSDIGGGQSHIDTAFLYS